MAIHACIVIVIAIIGWVGDIKICLPTGLLDTGEIPSKGLHSEIVLWGKSAATLQTLPPQLELILGVLLLTLESLKSRRIPLPFPPMIQRPRICVGRV